MRRLTLTQDIATSVEEHWRLFFDETYDTRQSLEGLGFSSYQILEHQDGPDQIVRRVRGVPKLEVPQVVAKVLGPSFGYTEEGRFDKTTGTWRSRLIPNVLAERLRSEAVVRCQPAGDGRCRRICELSVEATIFGIGGVIEAALEKDLRNGWAKSAAFMNQWLREQRTA
jgi:hypothetical protein